MLNINGTDYLTLKQYASLKNISVSRVSQIISTLPIDFNEDLDMKLINVAMLTLSEKEQTLIDTEFKTTEQVHKYSYKQLGMFVAETMRNNNDARTNAENLLSEKNIKYNACLEDLSKKNLLIEKLELNLSSEIDKNTQLSESFEHERGLNIKNQELINDLQKDNHDLIKKVEKKESEIQNYIKQITSFNSQDFDKKIESAVTKAIDKITKKKGSWN